MIDTVNIESPPIDDLTAKKIEQFATLRQGVIVRTNEIIYCITTAELKGTYESSIRIKVERDRFETFKEGNNVVNSKTPCEPFLNVECSLNKLVMGHNVYGGSNDLRQFQLLINFLQSEMKVKLPDYKEWILRRLDYAEEFVIGYKECYNYIHNIGNGYYARRNCMKYISSIYFPGTTTTLKFYHKGAEFKKFDYKRLKDIGMDTRYLNKLLDFANNVLRVEVEIKARKIKYDKGSLLKIGEYENIDYFKSIYDIEVKKMMKLVKDDKEYYDTYDAVEKILIDTYGKRTGSSLLGTWLKISLNGEEKVKSSMSKTTFYRQRKQLLDARCYWNHSIVEKNTDNIIDLLPYSDSKYKLKDYEEESFVRLQYLYEKYNVS